MQGKRRIAIGFIVGLLVGLLLFLLIPLAVLAMGLVDMSAISGPGRMERFWASWAFTQSMERRAPKTKNPYAGNPSVLPRGLDHYKANCVMCHGASGVEPGEIAKGLNPAPPRLDAPSVQSLSDGQLHWIIRNGIRMTGMPSFGKTHEDAEIWHIVAFVRHLPHLSNAERDALRESTEEESAHHHEGEEGHVHGEADATQEDHTPKESLHTHGEESSHL